MNIADAIQRIHELSQKQAELRRSHKGLLKDHKSDDPEIVKLRHAMYNNRAGKNGLRALNRRLSGTKRAQRKSRGGFFV